jgi:alanine racemase
VALRALASVNLAAIERNAALLAGQAGGATLCAVVKGDGYGHGAAPAARAALAGGARWLAVATAVEAAQIRDAAIDTRLLILGAISDEELPVALASGADVVAWDERFLARLLAEQRPQPVRVHVKLDSGMGRLGTRDLKQADAIARAVLDAGPAVELAGAMTHFATADCDQEFVAHQLQAFEPFADRIRKLAPGAVIHAANSAATLRVPAARHDMVRCGIALYGGDPMNTDPAPLGLEPAMTLTSYVAAVKRAGVGESAGYGRRFIAERETWLATLPIGYADGFSRAFTNNCEVLIGGRRYSLVGTVSMDNITVDLGPADPAVAVGQTATLIGSDGAERQTAEDLARRIGTINYEVLCAVSRRVPRAYHRDGASA